MTQPNQITADAMPVPVPDEDDDARLMTHAYDGIREYDNPLPGWWRMIFVGSIVFAGFYALYFHVIGWGSSPEGHYRAALASYQERRAAREGSEVASASEASLAHDAFSTETLAKGADVFAAKCVPCHKEHGEGLIGPNLTDQFQKHGSSRMDIYLTIKGGVQGTQMIAWGEQLPLSEVNAVAAYVTTLRGQNLPGKPPEGNQVGSF